MNILGIEIGGTKLQLVLGNETGQIRQRKRLKVGQSNGATGIRDQITRTLPELLADQAIDAAGVGFGGPVNWRTGKICRSHQITGWSEFDLRNWLQCQVGAPVQVDNDANVAALGEACGGARIGFEPVFYVTVGSGVGGGLVTHGRIYHGATPGESEIGHVRLDRAGTTVESRCSGWAIDARIRELKSTAPTGALARLVGDECGGEAKQLGPALSESDSTAQQLLLDVSEDLAFGLSHVVHLFHPQIIILGGGLSSVGEPLRAAVESALRRFTMEAFAPGPKVCLSKLGEDAVTIGALHLARAASAQSGA